MSSVPNAPTLTKKQQSKTLSAKKKSLKSIRNVLSSSRVIHWPLVEDDDRMIIFDQLNKISINKLKEKQKVKPSKIASGANIADVRKSVKFGINEIAKHLRDDDCSGVLVEAKIPHILAAHLVSVAISKNVPIFCIPGLKEALESTFGFKSSTVCFKKDCINGTFNNLLNVLNKIKSKNIQIYDQPSINCPLINKMETEEISQDSNPPIIKPEIVYLYRSNKKERVFTPPSSNKSSDIPTKDADDSQSYIKLLTNKNSANVEKGFFKPLVINRIKNNINRSTENQSKKKKNKNTINKT